MKRLKSKAGFSLIEMLVALMILVFIVIGMGVGMDAGSSIYRDATFEADSATLAGILNTNLGDILRYGQDIRVNTDRFQDSTGSYIMKDDVGFVFTSLDYGIQDAYFFTPVYEDGTSKGVLQIKNLRNDRVVELVNTGAYPDLVIADFEIAYVDSAANPTSTSRGGYFGITYTIYSANDDSLKRDVSSVVRLMND